jgi:hypothetical protein
MVLADLHSHSRASDGAFSPAEVAARAASHGVTLWALTDHDTVDGVAEARASALALGMDFLSGVEISVSYAGKTVHIVGLGVDTSNAQLLQGLAQTRSGRSGRMQAMADKLAALGIAGAYAGALHYAASPEALSRTHLAQFLVESGHCPTLQAAFDKYLADGKAAFVPFQWAKLADAVGWIRGAGGVAVIAHPARYKFDAMVEHALFTDFVAAGGQAVEVMTGSHQAHELPHYADLARQFGLAHSCGSDFHGVGNDDYDLGSYPSMNLKTLPPVWDLLHSRIVRAHGAGAEA